MGQNTIKSRGRSSERGFPKHHKRKNELLTDLSSISDAETDSNYLNNDENDL